jgi:hypothetical protein
MYMLHLRHILFYLQVVHAPNVQKVWTQYWYVHTDLQEAS